MILKIEGTNEIPSLVKGKILNKPFKNDFGSLSLTREAIPSSSSW